MSELSGMERALNVVREIVASRTQLRDPDTFCDLCRKHYRIHGHDPQCVIAELQAALAIADDQPNDYVTRSEAMRRACRATLMFHRGGAWCREKWNKLTGQDEATTKSLCDFVRAALAEPAEKPAEVMA